MFYLIVLRYTKATRPFSVGEDLRRLAAPENFLRIMTITEARTMAATTETMLNHIHFWAHTAEAHELVAPTKMKQTSCPEKYQRL